MPFRVARDYRQSLPVKHIMTVCVPRRPSTPRKGWSFAPCGAFPRLLSLSAAHGHALRSSQNPNLSDNLLFHLNRASFPTVKQQLQRDWMECRRAAINCWTTFRWLQYFQEHVFESAALVSPESLAGQVIHAAQYRVQLFTAVKGRTRRSEREKGRYRMRRRHAPERKTVAKCIQSESCAVVLRVGRF